MGEEMNQQLFYAPIGSDDEPIPFDGKVEVEEFPLDVEVQHSQLMPLSLHLTARIKRLRLKTCKLPRKVKKRLKTQLSKEIGIPTKELRVLTGWKKDGINEDSHRQP